MHNCSVMPAAKFEPRPESSREYICSLAKPSLSARHSFVKCRSHKAKHSITKPKQQPVPCGMISWSHTHPHPFWHSTRSQEFSYVSLLPEVKVACLERTEVLANGGVLGRCGRALAHGSGNVRRLAA